MFVKVGLIQMMKFAKKNVLGKNGYKVVNCLTFRSSEASIEE